MMNIKKWRNKNYLDWVRSLDCVITGMPAEAPHHITGHGQGGGALKSSDLFTMPLTTHFHVGDEGIHLKGVKEWERLHGSQWTFVADTINNAIFSGIIGTDLVSEEIMFQVKNQDHKRYLLSKIKGINNGA